MKIIKPITHSLTNSEDLSQFNVPFNSHEPQYENLSTILNHMGIKSRISKTFPIPYFSLVNTESSAEYAKEFDILLLLDALHHPLAIAKFNSGGIVSEVLGEESASSIYSQIKICTEDNYFRRQLIEKVFNFCYINAPVVNKSCLGLFSSSIDRPTYLIQLNHKSNKYDLYGAKHLIIQQNAKNRSPRRLPNEKGVQSN